MFFMANDASEGIWGEPLMICCAISLSELTQRCQIPCRPCRLCFPELTDLRLQVRFGLGNSFSSNLLFPWMITVVFPSGMRNIFRIKATVPILFKSHHPGSSVLSFFCDHTNGLVAFISILDQVNGFIPSHGDGDHHSRKKNGITKRKNGQGIRKLFRVHLFLVFCAQKWDQFCIVLNNGVDVMFSGCRICSY